MPKFKLFLKKRPHLCFVFLHSQTYAHQLILKRQWEEVGGTACLVGFAKNSFSLETTTYIEVHGPNVESDEAELRRHVKKSKSKAIILQSPYPEHYPDWFMDFAKEHDLAYAGYGISLSDYTEGQFNTPLIKCSRYLLAASEYEVSGFKETKLVNSEILFTGNPKMYEIRRRMRDSDRLNQTFTPRLLWAPHWSRFWLEGKRGFARWQVTIEPILEFAKNNVSVEVVVRPHPILREALLAFSGLEQNELNRESLKTLDLEADKDSLNLFSQLLSLENVKLSNSSLVEDVISSSHLITEGVSIIAYWAATGKPILVVRDEESPTFNEDGVKLMGQIDTAQNPLEISDWLGTLNLVLESERNDSLIRLSNAIYPIFPESPAQIFQKNLRGIKLNVLSCMTLF